MPFAVVGSERNVVIDGKATPGRRTKWGTINSKFFKFFKILSKGSQSL
jgi:septin family protein